MPIQGEVGTLHIGYSPIATLSDLLTTTVNSIRSNCPDLELRVTEIDPLSQIEAMEKQHLHFGLTAFVALDIPEDLATFGLANWPIYAVLPASHPLAERQVIFMKDIVDERFIVYRRLESHEYRRAESYEGARILSLLGNLEPDIGESVSNPLMVEPLVASGFGISLLPSVFRSFSQNDQVVYKPLKALRAQMDCSLIHRKVDDEPAVQLALLAARQGAEVWHQSDVADPLFRSSR
ncbi:LysR family substrate-binding domain-containing protein [Breoghania sp.]|uniref:LysR family substrate-binding domain-containing protein n=1 Tax=Breoghania sp. TaxID=2065378 RepID=UPI00262F1E8B|nr:LysR family substrate-binding domain-containing protein [Breoghania sp.]MDJ0931272.1 LysR family substrate-binding domain-containing protein [Breoghania sp.]